MRHIFAFLFLAISVLAQETNAPPPLENYAVRFYGANTNDIPVYWPKFALSVDTNYVETGDLHVFTQAQFDNLKLTNQAAFTAAKSNRLYAAQQQIKANLAAVVLAYSNLQWCADNWASVTNLNTLKIAVKAEGDLLLKLKPVLTQLYKGE